MRRDERPIAAVPPLVWGALVLALIVQIAWQAARHGAAPAAIELPPPPRPETLRLASFGETEAAARLSMLYLQAFDLRGLDYGRLLGWLDAILELAPRSQYPLFSAARIYAEHPDAVRSRMALDFVYHEFMRDPDRRWPWLAHAALLAKHRLRDLPLARRYAQAIDQYTTTPGVPLWAKQMEIFILEDMNELEAAKIMLGGLLADGTVRGAGERHFLRARLAELEARLKGQSVK
ncbi:MAG: hypothetical protein M3544_15865 [Pseudomonadota bacterium]|nr:hypothetical protein [Pseudomonadota bacterium]